MLKNKTKKLFLMIVMFIITFVVGTGYSIAAGNALLNDVIKFSTMKSLKGEAEGKVVHITREQFYGSDNENLYCMKKGAGFYPGNYRVTNYIRIEGDEAIDTNGQRVRNKVNATLTFLGHGGKNGEYDTGRGSGGNPNDIQQALWDFGNDWLSKVGEEFDLQWDADGKGTYHADDGGALQKAEEYAKQLSKDAKSNSNPDNNEDATECGPFNLTFNGKITSVTASDIDGNPLTLGPDFYVDLNSITSGSNFYIKNYSGFDIASVAFKGEGKRKIYTLDTWWLQTVDPNHDAETQRLVYIDAGEGEETFPIDIPVTVATHSVPEYEEDKASLYIKKIDVETKRKCARAEFVITGPTTYEGVAKYGELAISGMEYGTYDIYEVKAPRRYLLEDQTGYDSATERVYCGSVNLTKENPNQSRTFTNIEIIKIKGNVWKDNKFGKGNETNGYFDEGEGLEGVTVRLMKKGGGQVGAEQKTDEKGAYYFGKEYGVTKNTIKDYYIEFDYSKGNRRYIPVEPKFTEERGSKALATNFESAKGTPPAAFNEATFSGKAVTDINGDYGLSGTLGMFMDEKNVIQNVNLGIKDRPEVDFKVEQNLAYVKIVMKGYTYTYNYGRRGNSKALAAPTVHWQNKVNINAFTRAIYPSDIKYDIKNSTEELKVYVVYRIDITNPVNYDLQYLYREEELQIPSLTERYDKDRYTLETKFDVDNKNNDIASDFANWTADNKEGIATYNIPKYGFGVAPNSTETAYIQFKVNQKKIQEILKEPTIEQNQTSASAIGYHVYNRDDYSWQNNIVKNQRHTTETKSHTASAPFLIFKLAEDRQLSGKVFGDHVTTSNNIVLGNGKYDNKEKGIENVKVELVDATDDSTNIQEVSTLTTSTIYPKNYNVQNGMVTSAVSTNPNATPAKTTTDKNGNFSFTGIVPGEYYLKFTYGDGTQKITDVNGKEVTLTALDYKSTIVTLPIAKQALKGPNEAKKNANIVRTSQFVKNNNNTSKLNYIWYKHLEDGIKKEEKNNYSTAVDSLIVRKQINDTAKANAVIDNKDKATIHKEAQSEKRAIPNAVAGTSRISIPVEITHETEADEDEQQQKNQQSVHVNKIEGINLGIIEQPRRSVVIDKVITNTKVTSGQGNIIMNGNPVTDKMQGVSDLTKRKSNEDEFNKNGSKYTKIEVPEEQLYGSTLELTYQIRVTNTSDINYYNEEYYKFGDKNDDKEATITIDTLKDSLTQTVTFMENQGSTKGLKEAEDEKGKVIESDENGHKFKIIKSDPIEKLYTENNKSHDSNETQSTFRVVAQKVLSTEDDDLEFINEAQIPTVFEEGTHNVNNTPSRTDSDDAQVQVDKTVISKIDLLDTKSSTTVTVVPPTGADLKTPLIYAGVTALALAVLSAVIIIIKKKIL